MVGAATIDVSITTVARTTVSWAMVARRMVAYATVASGMPNGCSRHGGFPVMVGAVVACATVAVWYAAMVAGSLLGWLAPRRAVAEKRGGDLWPGATVAGGNGGCCNGWLVATWLWPRS
jgi:hypothetical protein